MKEQTDLGADGVPTRSHSSDPLLDAEGINGGGDDDLSIPPVSMDSHHAVGALPGQSAQELLGRGWKAFVPSED